MTYSGRQCWCTQRWLRESVFSHRCVRTQAATLTWLAYMTLHVYMLQICKLRWNRYLRSCTALWKNAFSQSSQYICVHQHGDRDTDVSGKSTEIYGAASSQTKVGHRPTKCLHSSIQPMVVAVHSSNREEIYNKNATQCWQAFTSFCRISVALSNSIGVIMQERYNYVVSLCIV